MRSLCLLAALVCFSCSTIKKTPVATADLYTSAQEWPVKVNDGWLSAKTISYGNYTTSSRRNGITPAANITFVKTAENAFNFTVKDSAEQILVQSLNARMITFSGRSLPASLAKLPASTQLFYVLVNGIQSAPLVRWELILKSPHYLELNENKPAGVLRSPGEEIGITAHNRFGIMNSYEKICFEFREHGTPVAAVVPGAQPRVWVSKRITKDKEKILAAAIGALLLRE
jgi:antitoxin (DNA-binding transcriptional repressor) of toxin-antitoxin stability system